MPQGPTPQTSAEQHPLLRLVDPQRVPAHVAIIMDGNGRWAKARGLPRIEGHKAGIDAVRQAISARSMGRSSRRSKPFAPMPETRPFFDCTMNSACRAMPLARRV